MKAPTLKVVGAVCGGRLDAPASLRLRDALKRFDGQKIVIALSEWTKPRSVAQNAYWFAVLHEHAVPVFRSYGDAWTNWDIHEHVMEALGYQKVLKGKGGKLTVARLHSSDFSTRQWETFMEEARAHLAQEHGIALPLPGEEIS